MYVVIGATGHTGSAVAEKLLAKREKVRVVGRDERRLERFKQGGAEAFVGDVSDASAMARAFSGAEAAYLMVPPNISSPNVLGYQQRVSEALAAALENSGVRHGVVLSSYGADKPDKTGPVVGLHALEAKLDAIPGLNVLFIRAGYFMENILPQVNVIPSLGRVAGPVRSDLALPMIASRDIGAFTAEALSRPDFQGKQRRELLGARDVTYTQVVKVVGAAIGKPDLTYKQLPAAQLKPALTQMGMSPNMADLLLEMAEALNSGHCARSNRVHHKTPRRQRSKRLSLKFLRRRTEPRQLAPNSRNIAATAGRGERCLPQTNRAHPRSSSGRTLPLKESNGLWRAAASFLFRSKPLIFDP